MTHQRKSTDKSVISKYGSEKGKQNTTGGLLIGSAG